MDLYIGHVTGTKVSSAILLVILLPTTPGNYYAISLHILTLYMYCYFYREMHISDALGSHIERRATARTLSMHKTNAVARCAVDSP
jgi:hypothetical protein